MRRRPARKHDAVGWHEIVRGKLDDITRHDILNGSPRHGSVTAHRGPHRY